MAWPDRWRPDRLYTPEFLGKAVCTALETLGGTSWRVLGFMPPPPDRELWPAWVEYVDHMSRCLSMTRAQVEAHGHKHWKAVALVPGPLIPYVPDSQHDDRYTKAFEKYDPVP